MAKILLVEDDNNLREIYEARLQAEGYDIVSAQDGEEALVVAKAELPDLVISDVMMPKISGFEMLDILRNTEGLRDVKVIMLTALGQAEDQSRADSLGADRYLVKSQVTLEDIVNAAQQLLGGGSDGVAAAAAGVGAASTEPAAEPSVQPTPEPVAEPAVEQPESEPAPVIPVADEPASTPPVSTDEVTEPTTPVATEPVAPASPAAPTNDSDGDDSQQTEAQESATVEQQIEDFVASQPGTPPAAVEPAVEPVTEPAPAPADETPPAATPTTTAEQEQILNDAVNSLSGIGSDPAAEAPVPDTPAAEPVAEPAPVETPSVDEPTPTETDEAGTSTHKKIIEPITDDGQPKKSLDQLVAEENAKEAATQNDGQSATQPAKSDQPSNGDFDPNSIAL